MTLLYLYMTRRALSAVVVTAALAGCASGPDFHAPPGPRTERYTAEALDAETVAAPVLAGNAQRFVTGADIPAQWSALFGSGSLDRLIRQALADSPTLAAAQATLRQAQEDLRAGSGALMPRVDVGAGVARQRARAPTAADPSATAVYDLYNASVQVSYTLDTFGGVRRQIEALQAQVDFHTEQLEAAHLALTANLVTTAVQEAALRAQRAATLELVAIQQRQFDLLERRWQLGGIARGEVLAQQALLAQTRASLPGLDLGLARTRHRLAVLAGRLPDAGDLPEFTLEALQLPVQLPVSVPSALVRQRPDIRAAEALLHSANALVGVTTANLYPQITLSGSYGFAATSPGRLLDGRSLLWSAGASLLQPLFDAGRLDAQRAAAVAAHDAAAAQYRSTVLLAFQNVADTLRALQADALALQAQAEAEASARASLDLATRQYQLGAVSSLAVLDAQRQYQQARIALVGAQAARHADTAALFQAMGGGWWNRPDRADIALDRDVSDARHPNEPVIDRKP